MKDIVKSGIVSAAIAMTPLSASAGDISNDRGILQQDIKSEISAALDSVHGREGVEFYVDARLFTNAALRYFDEEVKLYELKGESRKKVESILNSYFSAHPILKLSQNGNMTFEIDDKAEFSKMVKDLTNAILSGMNPVFRTFAITIAFGSNSSLQRQLNDLDGTIMDMKKKNYKNIIFDYFGGIVKRVAISAGGKMTVKDYYNNVSKYYPNKNNSQILEEIEKSGQGNVDVKNLQYPFKK